LFGETPRGASRVLAICDWIRSKITYEYGHTTSSTGAFDMVTERIGVCRDFRTLRLLLPRAQHPGALRGGLLSRTRPARFSRLFSGLFSAATGLQRPARLVVYFDATYERVRHGLVNISVGRDAVDTSMMTFFGSAHLVVQTCSGCKVTTASCGPAA
jgi:hypothetical protein